MEDDSIGGFSFYPDFATVTGHDFIADRQPDARPFISGYSMQSFERLEYFFNMLFFDPNTIIFNRDFTLSLVITGMTQGDHRGDIFSMVFQGVSDQVQK